MAKSNDFGVGLMHETAITASKAGWEPEDIANLSKDENLLRLIRGVLHGTHEIKGIEHIIDCDAPPFVPEGWKVEEHQRAGIVTLDACGIEFYASKKQKDGSIDGYTFREELEGKKVINANVMDYFLANVNAIPQSWQDKDIYFWGTIYRDKDNRMCVRCLYWCDDKWRWGHDRLSAGWAPHNLTALFAG